MVLENGETAPEVTWQPDPKEFSTWREDKVSIYNIVVLLDGSTFAAEALPVAKMLSRTTGAALHLLSSVKDYTPELKESFEEEAHGRNVYLEKLSNTLRSEGYKASYKVSAGFLADVTAEYVETHEIDLVVLSTHGKSGEKNWQRGGVTRKLVQKIWKPILMVQAITDENHTLPRLKHILVALDGSLFQNARCPTRARWPKPSAATFTCYRFRLSPAHPNIARRLNISKPCATKKTPTCASSCKR